MSVTADDQGNRWGMDLWSISASSGLQILAVAVRVVAVCMTSCWLYMQMIKGVGDATVRGMDLWSISMSSGLPEQYAHNSLQSAHQSKADGQANGQHNGQADGPDGGQAEGSIRRRDIPLSQQAPFIDDELPSAVHIQQDSSIQGSKRAGKFTYYFTVGLDAEAAYRCVKCPCKCPCVWHFVTWQRSGPLTTHAQSRLLIQFVALQLYDCNPAVQVNSSLHKLI